MSDKINPDHYKHGGIETIEYIKAKMTPQEYYGYIKGNAIKYISREGLKSDKIIDKIEDLKKAHWYIDRMILVHQEELAVIEAKMRQDEWIDDALNDES
jgi:hypothetical protein